MTVFVNQRAWAQVASDPGQAAASAYKEALAQYDAGDVAGSLAKMRESYRLSQRPELLYNIARLESELGDCRASLEHYRKYAQQVPDGRYRSEAEHASQQLAAQCPEAAPEPEAQAQQPARPAVSALALAAPARPAEPRQSLQTREAPPVSRPKPPTSYWTAPRVIGWSLVSAGVGAGIGAAYFFEDGREAHDRLQKEVDRELAGGAYANQDLQATVQRDRAWEIALAATGGALVAGGVLVLVLAPSNGQKNATTASFGVAPGAFSARVGLTF